ASLIASSARPGELASPVITRARSPSESTAFLAVCGLRPVITTPRAPAARNARAAESPSPDVPPIITRLLPARVATCLSDFIATAWPGCQRRQLNLNRSASRPGSQHELSRKDHP